MATMDFDELHKLNDTEIKWKMRSMDYESYFGEMKLTETQKKERIETAEKFEKEILFVLSLIAVSSQFSTVDWQDIENRFQTAYFVVFGDRNSIDEYTLAYITDMSRDFTETSRKGMAVGTSDYDSYYTTSYDRARNIAENETNTILNHNDFEDAKSAGYTLKTWDTMLDKKVRDTHSVLEGKTIPIDEPFIVGNSLMMYPRDVSTYGADPDDYAGCRCSVTYS